MLLREDRGPVAVLTLNRPEARNSLSEELIAALDAAVREIGGADAVRAIVITGAGSAFSSGHDLKELTAHRNDPDRGRAFFAKTMAACSDMMLAIVRSPEAGDRRGERHRHGRRLPARRELRSRGRQPTMRASPRRA